MIKLSAICCAIAVATAGSTLYAAQAAVGTLKDAVERAILQNPEVKLRFHNLQAAKSEQRVAEGAWFPRLDLEVAGGSYQTKSPSIPSARGYSGNRANLQLRQTLFDGFASLNETQRLSYAQQSAYFDLMSASNQTALEAARAYLDVLRYRELVQLAADNYTTHEEVHDRLNQKVTAGVGRKVDLEQAAGRMALAESNWLTEVSNLHDVSARYQRLVGEIPAPSLAPVDAIAGTAKIAPEFNNQVIRQNPEFQSAVATIRSYRADSSVRRGPLAPTVELRARQSFETNQGGTLGDYQDTNLELVLNYNLFRGGADKARVDQYVAKLNSAFDLRDKACRDIWQTAGIAFNDAQKLKAQINFLAQHELSTSKAKQAYQQQFDIGQRSLLDLLDTENELYQARRALAAAEYDMKLSSARILAVSGSLLGALNLQALSTELPDAKGNTQADDDLLQCSQQSPALPTLDRITPTRSTATESTAIVPATDIPSATTPAAPTPTTTASKEPDTKNCSAIPQVVTDWLQAWNSKDLTKYLASYSSNFVPANGMSLKKWQKMRKNRVTKDGELTVTANAITPVSCDTQKAEVSFAQQYGSKNYTDTVQKTLFLENNQGIWKITKEVVTQGRSY